MKVTLKQTVKICIFDATYTENLFGGSNYIPPMVQWINHGNIKIVDFDDADIIVFPPGAPIHPKMYGEQVCKYLGPGAEAKDVIERMALKKAIKMGKFIIGIQRGAMLCNIHNNGNVIQHINHHTADHQIKDSKTNKLYNVTSSHTELMFPYNLKPQSYEIVAYATKSMCKKSYNLVYLNGDECEVMYKSVPCKYLDNLKDPEIVYFPRTACFAVQPNLGTMTQTSHAQFLEYLNEQLLTRFMAFEVAKLTNKKTDLNEEENRHSVLAD